MTIWVFSLDKGGGSFYPANGLLSVTEEIIIFLFASV
jgi:hypothetical protein